jgi:dCTP deaminase
LFEEAALRDDSYFTARFGLFAHQEIRAMSRRRLIQAYNAIDESQYQPASLDLRLGKEVYRVRASFLPGRNRTGKEHLDSLNPERMALTGDGAVSISPR